MKHGKGIPMPKKREMKNAVIFEEMSGIKNLGNKVLLMHTMTAAENTVLENRGWRIKTFESFKRKVENTAIDYTGGYDEEIVSIHDPVFHDVVYDEGEPMPEERQVIIHFSATIPTNIGGKELLN